MHEEKNPLDELLFIKKVIQDSQKIMVDNGMGFIIWGILVSIGMLFGYIKFTLDLQFDYIWAWVIIISLGWIYSYFAYRRKRVVKVETFAGKMMGALWFAAGVSMTIVGFGGYFSGAIAGSNISSIIAIILGAAYFVSSVLYDWKWFKLFGAIWWAGGFLLFYINGIYQFLIMPALMIFCQIVPGIIFYRKYKAQYSEKK